MHEKFMRAALAEAKKGLGKTSPNPAVGAVLVNGNRIIAQDITGKRAAIMRKLIACES